MTFAGTVVAVASNPEHTVNKTQQASIALIANQGVEGDAHCGVTVRHLWSKKRNPGSLNMRQVHLMHAELFDRLRERGFAVQPGDLGENITTRGIDILALAEGATLTIGAARIRVTGLRSPCFKIDKLQKGLLAEMIVDKRAQRFLSGIMAVVESGGTVRPGDAISVAHPPGPFHPLVPI